MSITISPPTDRSCERCGRKERWEEPVEAWQIGDDPGDAFCIHEWDVNGTYVPFEE